MRNHQLRVDMQRFNGEEAYALYSNFSVGDENSKYQLTVQGYSGNAGARIKSYKGLKNTSEKKYVHFSDLIICHKRFKYELHQEIQQQTLKRGRIG